MTEQIELDLGDTPVAVETRESAPDVADDITVMRECIIDGFRKAVDSTTLPNRFIAELLGISNQMAGAYIKGVAKPTHFDIVMRMVKYLELVKSTPKELKQQAAIRWFRGQMKQ